MPISPCDLKITCLPCDDSPFSNTSAEGIEPFIFVARHVIIRPPTVGRIYAQQGCKRWCYSSISQADADACAAAQASECVNDTEIPQPPAVVPPIIPPSPYPVVTVFATEPETQFGEDPGIFTLSRNGTSSVPLTVQFALSGSAKNGVDYQFLTASATIDAGDSAVDVIVIPEDTDSTDSKSVILTVLGTGSYVAGAHNHDTVTISSVECGEEFYTLTTWGPSQANEVAAMMPNAKHSDLPEWDGYFRRRAGEGVYRSNSECFAIAGKKIEILLTVDNVLIEKTACPSGWIEALPDQPGCYSCVFGFVQNTTFTSDLITISDDANDKPIFFVSQTTGVVGDYRLYSSPVCEHTFLGQTAYDVDDDGYAHYTFGEEAMFSVIPIA